MFVVHVAQEDNEAPSQLLVTETYDNAVNAAMEHIAENYHYLDAQFPKFRQALVVHGYVAFNDRYRFMVTYDILTVNANEWRNVYR